MKPLRVYVDTSVFGGCFDAEFAEQSTRFFDLVRIVRVDKMRAYNQVNLQAGFGLLSIVSPQEVRFDEDT